VPKDNYPGRAQMEGFLERLAMEPPFRILVRALLRAFAVSARTRALWEISERPAYLLGVLTGAQQALAQNVPEISVIEFGVAGGNGLVALQAEAEAVERETGVRVKVYGFDMGQRGLPELLPDYRDHPDAWKPGDFPMDEAALRARLTERTTLVIGNVKESVAEFFSRYQPPPIGFISFDMDLYSSTRDGLRLLAMNDRRMLWHVPLYFDDIDFLFNHRFAGELLAIDEFNQEGHAVRIDKWYGVRKGRPFPERPFLDKLYVAHDLQAVSGAILTREAAKLALKA
jgi:hypothetical protein